MFIAVLSSLTIFFSQPGQCGLSPNSSTDPGHHAWYVKTYCTHNALGRFTLYFPYILLLSALVLAGVERLFKKIFKTNVQVEGFYSLLLTAKKIEVSIKIPYIETYIFWLFREWMEMT